MNENLSPTVCLDGSAVRRIREEKDLTQLYVAKVVGVTTDTISRWENNRYPTIKRSNAIRLTEALEVDLEQILRAETDEEDVQAPASRWRHAPWVFALILLLAALASWQFSGHDQSAVGTVRAQRLLPNYAAPGSILPVRVRLETEGELTGFILREHFPQGWKLIEASPPPSSLDNVEGIARWIIKADQSPPIISYRIQVAVDAAGKSRGKFLGEVVADPRDNREAEVVDGNSEVVVDNIHWADSDADKVIADWEVLRASDTVDEMQKVHLDWDIIEAIWDAGSYRWDSKSHRFIPVRDIPPSIPDTAAGN